MDKMDKIFQDLKDSEAKHDQLKAELEERKAAWEMKDERLRAKIKELEEQKADQEAQLNYQKSLAQMLDNKALQPKKLEGFPMIRIPGEDTKFTVLINTEIEEGLFTEPVGFTFPDYKSMDDFIQMALIHGQNNIRFTIKKGGKLEWPNA